MPTTKQNRSERVIAFLESRYPGWVPAVELEPVGGRQAWRTAVSEARALLRGRGGDIENRWKYQFRDERQWVLSEYRLKKGAESSPERGTPTVGHNLNDGFSLR